MPEPMHAEPAHYEEETVLHEATPAPVSMPLPALNEVTTRFVVVLYEILSHQGLTIL